VFSRLGQSFPPIRCRRSVWWPIGDADPLSSYTGTIAAPSLGVGDRFLSHERPVPIQALGAASVGAFAFTFSYTATMAALVILAESLIATGKQRHWQ